MSTTTRNTLREIMNLAWQFVKQNGFSMSEALQIAWRNVKLRAQLALKKVTKFYFQKVDGSIREAYGTLRHDCVPPTGDGRKPNATIQVYFDTEKQEWRCFKKANLLSIA